MILKSAIIVLLEMVCIANVYSQEVEKKNPFVYEDGKLSIGIVSGDTLALYDIFKKVDDINTRVGGSITIAKYDRFGVFVGAAAPSVCPANVAVVGGPSLDLDDVSKAMIKSMLEVLPFKIAEGTIENIASASVFKIYGGYDFRFKGSIAGAGFGLKLF